MKKTIAGVLVAIMLLPTAVSAQTITNPDLQASLLAQISQLVEIVQQLQAQLAEMKATQKEIQAKEEEKSTSECEVAVKRNNDAQQAMRDYQTETQRQEEVIRSLPGQSIIGFRAGSAALSAKRDPEYKRLRAVYNEANDALGTACNIPR
jgi:hypothetical protein